MALISQMCLLFLVNLSILVWIHDNIHLFFNYICLSNISLPKYVTEKEEETSNLFWHAKDIQLHHLFKMKNNAILLTFTFHFLFSNYYFQQSVL